MSAHDFLGLLYCCIVLLCISIVSCFYYPTVMVRYSLFVLKVPLNPKQTNNLGSSRSCCEHSRSMCCQSLNEYASSVWSPYLVTDIRKVESVHRKVTKRLPGCSHLSYPDRLVRLNLDTLVVRCLRHDLIFTYKIIFGVTPRTLSHLPT